MEFPFLFVQNIFVKKAFQFEKITEGFEAEIFILKFQGNKNVHQNQKKIFVKMLGNKKLKKEQIMHFFQQNMF